MSCYRARFLFNGKYLRGIYLIHDTRDSISYSTCPGARSCLVVALAGKSNVTHAFREQRCQKAPREDSTGSGNKKPTERCLPSESSGTQRVKL